jgi:hypothetical protein
MGILTAHANIYHPHNSFLVVTGSAKSVASASLRSSSVKIPLVDVLSFLSTSSDRVSRGEDIMFQTNGGKGRGGGGQKVERRGVESKELWTTYFRLIFTFRNF